MQMGTDDQIAWHAYVHLVASVCHRESKAIHHPDEIALDYNAELFLSVFGVPLHNFYLRRGEVWVHPFGRLGVVGMGCLLRTARMLWPW